MKKACFWRAGLILLIAAAVFAAAVFVFSHRLSFSYEPVPYEESSRLLSNPYEGFYHIRGYFLSDENPELSSQVAQHIAWDEEFSLVLLQINLQNYRSCPLSPGALSQLEEIFSAWETAGKQMIVRFLYDWDGQAELHEPDSVAQVMEHMEQAAACINRHADHIYILQGVFLGNVGEMHSSALLDDDSMTRLAGHLASLTDPSVFLSVRTPAQWRGITGNRELPDPFPAFLSSSDNLTGRLGLFNDGMLGSETDVGTYNLDSRYASDSLWAEGNRQEELAFQESLCRYVPNGGEVVLDNPYNDLPAAISDLRQMHVSYLNAAHDGAVLDKWKNTVCSEAGCFLGSSGYDYIRAHLGYRYVLRDSSLEKPKTPGDAPVFSLSLENVGFAGCLVPLQARILISNTQSGQELLCPADWDLRLLESGALQTYTLDLPLDTLPKGTYRLFLQLADPASGRLIQLANEGTQDQRGFDLGGLTLQ